MEPAAKPSCNITNIHIPQHSSDLGWEDGDASSLKLKAEVLEGEHRRLQVSSRIHHIELSDTCEWGKVCEEWDLDASPITMTSSRTSMAYTRSVH
jgi:hypothetical protein